MLKFLLLPIALLAVGCSQPAQPAKSDMGDMKESAGPAATGPIRGTATVTAVNAASGMITLRHEPIPAIQWSAMTMEFHAEHPAILQGIAVGDQVSPSNSRAQTNRTRSQWCKNNDPQAGH